MLESQPSALTTWLHPPSTMKKYSTLSYHKTSYLCCVGENFTVESYKVQSANEKILIVDDERTIRQVLKKKIEK